MESRILELLMQKDGSNNRHFPKLFPECVQSISESITDILYDSLTTNKQHTNYRLDILELLRKCFIRQKHNFKIDITNYDCLINTLTDSKALFKYAADNLYSTIQLENNEFKGLDSTLEIIEYFTKIQNLNMQRLKQKEMVQIQDQIKCANTNFSYTSQFFTSKDSELCSAIERLELLKKEELCKNIEHESIKHTECPTTSESKENLRKKEIQMAYSLLNLNKSNSDFLLLSNILKNVCSYENLLHYEIEFVEHLWKNWELLQIPPEVVATLLDSFTFIYEKEIIELCTKVIEEEEIDATAADIVIKKLLEVSKNNQKLLYNIKSIFYELYCCSGYNNKLYKYLDIFEEVK